MRGLSRTDAKYDRVGESLPMFQRKFQLFFIDASSLVSMVTVAERAPVRTSFGSRTQLAVGLVFAPPVKTSDDPVHRASVPFITVAAPSVVGALLGTLAPAVSSKTYSARRPDEGIAVSAAAGAAARGTTPPTRRANPVARLRIALLRGRAGTRADAVGAVGWAFVIPAPLPG